jgi:hypothetical protein
VVDERNAALVEERVERRRHRPLLDLVSASRKSVDVAEPWRRASR